MKWLERDMVPGPHLALALCETDFLKAVRHMRVPREKWPAWLADDSNGCVHTFHNPSGALACVVSMRVNAELSGIEVAAVLVHEAVHVFQQWCNHHEERAPSREFEAYSIESIAQRLMEAYAKQSAAAITRAQPS